MSYSSVKCKKSTRLMAGAFSLIPRNIYVSIFGGTVGQIKIYECLVWDAGISGFGFKKGYCIVVDIDGDLLFELFCVWVLSWI